MFCKIVKGEIPVHKIYEDENSLVVMDKFPAVGGQVLLIAKEHVPYVFNLSSEKYSSILLTAKKIAKIMDDVLGSEKTCLLIEGFEVPHAHIKLFPTYGLRLEIHGGKETDDKVLKETADRLKKGISEN